MALPVNIDDLVNHRKVEWARIEYKEGWNPEKVLHTICAFANDIDNWGGGYVILGVAEEDGKPVFPVKGLRESEIDTINKELLEKCHLDLVEGRNTGVPVIVNAMRSNQSPDPVFSTPETRAWFSVVLPVHPAFKQVAFDGHVSGGREISQKIAQKKQWLIGADNLPKSGKVVSITAEEELCLVADRLEDAWKISQKISQKNLSAKSLDRWSRIVQAILRDGSVTALILAQQLHATYRTIQSDMRILKALEVIRRDGPDKGGKWIVTLEI